MDKNYFFLVFFLIKEVLSTKPWSGAKYGKGFLGSGLIHQSKIKGRNYFLYLVVKFLFGLFAAPGLEQNIVSNEEEISLLLLFSYLTNKI